MSNAPRPQLMPAHHTTPSAAKGVVCIDFDATIQPWGPLTESRRPFEGVRVAMLALRDAGYQIVILTSRMSPRWWEADWQRNGAKSAAHFGREQESFVRSYMEWFDLPWDLITAEKVPAMAYFDDKGVHVPEGQLPLALNMFIMEHGDHS